MIRVYHTSDLHDRRGIAEPLRTLRAQRPGLLFDCGDALRGSQSIYHRDEPIVGEMDAAGYDAQAIGNREFHYFFGLLRARARAMRHPLVCTNLVDTKHRELPFAPALQFAVPGDGDCAVRIHVLGVLVMQYATGSPWERVFGWRFLTPWDAVASYAGELPEDDLLLVLSHIGLSRDRELAARVPRIDLILGGHSHDTLEQPERIDGVPIVHAGPYGHFVSRSELQYDTTSRRFELASSELVPLLRTA